MIKSNKVDILDRKNLKITIEDVLKEKNISKAELCKAMDISQATLEKYCSGDIRYLDVTFIKKVCFYLQCDIKDILKYVK